VGPNMEAGGVAKGFGELAAEVPSLAVVNVEPAREWSGTANFLISMLVEDAILKVGRDYLKYKANSHKKDL